MGSEGDEEEEAMAEIGSAVYPHQSSVAAAVRGATAGVGGYYAIWKGRRYWTLILWRDGQAQSCLACCTLG